MDARLRRVNKEITGTPTLELGAAVVWVNSPGSQIARTTERPTSRSS